MSIESRWLVFKMRCLSKIDLDLAQLTLFKTLFYGGAMAVEAEMMEIADLPDFLKVRAMMQMHEDILKYGENTKEFVNEEIAKEEAKLGIKLE